MQLPPQKKVKPWVAWFRAKGPTQRHGTLFVVPVEITETRREQKSKKKRRELIISIPRACGNAVKRNRLKRIIRAEISGRAQVDLWIRLQNRFRLDDKLLSKDWSPELAKATRAYIQANP